VGELERARSDHAESVILRGVVPELLFALAVLSPEREKALSTYLERTESRRRQRAVEFEQDVLKYADLSSEELLRRILDDEAAAELFEQAVMRAIATAEHKKREALARAVASGLLADDSATMDVAQLQMRAIGMLEPAHFRLLLDISKYLREGPFENTTKGIPVGALQDLFPWAGAAVYPMLAELQSQGFVSRPGPASGGSWSVTPFGRSVLDLLSETKYVTLMKGQRQQPYMRE
jgi:hypothetical protein